MRVRKKTVLEQELTTEQVNWLKAHPDHDRTKSLVVEARVADWDGIKEKRIRLFKVACSAFRKWWESEMNVPKSPEG
ncbi:MAG: hypothetical protein PHW62_00300 [Candidatus Ratteibacteria bacterium]|nr:hypothetical protein [Candidatus Ratteibacteria bacterium]